MCALCIILLYFIIFILLYIDTKFGELCSEINRTDRRWANNVPYCRMYRKLAVTTSTYTDYMLHYITAKLLLVQYLSDLAHNSQLMLSNKLHITYRGTRDSWPPGWQLC